MAQLIVLALFAASALAFVGARYAVIRHAGATRFREGLFITRDRWDAASTLVKIGFCVVGPLAVYVLSAVLFFVAFKLDGENRPGEPTQVRVAPGMPAAAAGVKDGDKIVAIDGARVTAFEEVSQAVQASKGELKLEVERGGERIFLDVVPEVQPGPVERRVIGVWPFVEKVPASVLSAARGAVTAPAMVAVSTLRAFWQILSGSSQEQPGGPAKIVQEVERTRQEGGVETLFLAGALSAYLVLLVAPLSLFSVPWRKKKKA